MPGVPDSWGKADLHIHSAAGDGVASVEEIVEYVERRGELDLIAITDHDEISGAQAARDLVARRNYRFDVIVGTEISTRHGHLIALFVERPFPMLRSLVDTIAAVHKQGGICIVPHPMSWLAMSVGQRLLTQLACHPSSAVYLDGIETFNPTFAGRVVHNKVTAFNQAFLGLPELGGSDAHHLHQIGSGHTLFEGRTAEDFRQALLTKRTAAGGQFWTAGDHLQGMASQQLRALVIHPALKLRRAVDSIWTQVTR